MNHCGTKTIETDRLILRAFRQSDVEPAYRNWTSDIRVTEFLRWQTHSDISVTERLIKNWVEKSKSPNVYQWAIVLKEIDEPIGSISVVEQNEALGILNIGYCIGSKWWHKGITSEAFQAIIPYLFNEVGANRIEAMHDPNNPNSGAVMRKCGLKYEGTLRQADFNNRGIVDICMYSLLKSEFAHGEQPMKLKNVLIVVKDIEKSKQFYHDLFGLELVLDNDGNMILTDGLVLQDERIWREFIKRDIVPKSNACELYFEEKDIEAFVQKLERLYPSVQYVNRLMTHSWGQRVIRFYDLDGNLIEVGTPM